MSEQHIDPGPRLVQPASATRWLVVGGLLALAAVQLWWSRYHFLDDAFIHLRIGENLFHHGVLAFNPTEPAFVSSSPLYTSLLGLVSYLAGGAPWTPKLVNLIAFMVLLLLIARRAMAARDRSRFRLGALVLALMVSPFAVRWLSDGMETGLVALTAYAIAAAGREGLADRPVPTGVLLWQLALSFLAVLLRVELAFVLGILGLGLLWHHLRPGKGEITGRSARARLALASRAVAPFALGTVLALATLLLLFGNLLPDAAVAKAANRIGLVDNLRSIVVAHGASSSFGVGLPVLGSTLLALAWRRCPACRPSLIVIAASLPILCLLILVRQQQVQGIRYFVFLEAFIVFWTWRTLEAAGADADASPTPRSPGRSGWRRLVTPSMALALVVVAWQAFDLRLFARIVEGRSETYLRFAAHDFEPLHGQVGVAWDVGMIGYFSRGHILDVNGLVNGRELARLSHEQRIARFAADPRVAFVFANEGQQARLAAHLSVQAWPTTLAVDFPNVSGQPDTHLLWVRSQR